MDKSPQFKTIDELDAFWNDHDLAYHLAEMEEVDPDEALPGRRLVPLSPDVAAAFPTPEAVNEALRLVLRLSPIPTVGDERPTAV
jgi:hypothetical protein